MSKPDETKAKQVFGWRLRAVRRAYGGSIGKPDISARRFARALGLTDERYRRYERGELEPPLGVLTSLCRLTGISLDLLVCGDQNGDDNMIPPFGIKADEEIILADRMRGVRELASLSVEEAAKILNVADEELLAWECGKTRPALNKLQEFAVRFNLTLDFLLEGRPEGLDQTVRGLLLSKFPLAHRGNPGSTKVAPSEHTAVADSGKRAKRTAQHDLQAGRPTN